MIPSASQGDPVSPETAHQGPAVADKTLTAMESCGSVPARGEQHRDFRCYANAFQAHVVHPHTVDSQRQYRFVVHHEDRCGKDRFHCWRADQLAQPISLEAVSENLLVLRVPPLINIATGLRQVTASRRIPPFRPISATVGRR